MAFPANDRIVQLLPVNEILTGRVPSTLLLKACMSEEMMARLVLAEQTVGVVQRATIRRASETAGVTILRRERPA